MIYSVVIILFILIGYQAYLIKKYKNLNEDEMSYVATLTHDLKSPAAAQINMLNLLLKGQFGQLNSKQYEMLKLTCSSAKYMSNLVGNVLSEYKVYSKSVVLNKTEFELINLIKSVIANYEPLIIEKQIKVIFNTFPDECIIYADRSQIERVIINLLSNAIIYGLNNSVIAINLSCSDETITFAISNKSYYIPSYELKRIFNKFSKTRNSKLNTHSTGLGLYVAKQIITMHEGKIFANSTPNGICTFGFQLTKSSSNAKLVKK